MTAADVTKATPPRRPPGDDELVDRLRRGDTSAFEEVIRSLGGRLLQTARRILGSEEEARDAVQDAFVSVLKSIGSFEATAMLSTWLHRVVINASLMRLRRRRRRPEEAIETYLPRFLEDGHAAHQPRPWAHNAEAVFARAELAQLVRQSIDRLPESYRVVVLLRDIEELSTDETAALLGVTPNAVKIRLHRGRQALRELLEPLMKEV